MTDAAEKPIDDSNELTEAQLDQVAGGVKGYKSADLETKRTQPEKNPQPAAGRHVGAT